MRNRLLRKAAGTPERRSEDRTRRRFARRQWRRRWGLWRPVLAVVVVLALVATGVWLVLFSSHLAVKDIQVSGTGLLNAGDIRKAARIEEGRPLVRVDLAGIEGRIEGLAPVRGAVVTREWPSTIKIVVTERTPIAVVDLGGEIRGMDDQGVVFRDYPRKPGDLPLVRTTGHTTSAALAEAAEVVGALPAALSRRVEHLSVITVDQIYLVLRDGRVVSWGSAEESALKAQVLAALLKEPAKVYDVSVPGQPTKSQRPPATPIP